MDSIEKKVLILGGKEFRVREESWFKRREPTEKNRHYEVVCVYGFSLSDGHRCVMRVKVDGVPKDLNARVYKNCTYGTDGSEYITSWGVQGISASGDSVSLGTEVKTWE